MCFEIGNDEIDDDENTDENDDQSNDKSYEEEAIIDNDDRQLIDIGHYIQ